MPVTASAWSAAMVPANPACSPLFAATYYVDPLGAHEWPYDTWETAATDIQSAIDNARGIAKRRSMIFDRDFSK